MIRSPATACLAAVLASLLPAAAGAAQEDRPVRIHEREETYAVTGATDEGVWDSLVAGARQEGEELIFAWTDVSMEYRSRMVRREGACHLVAARIDVRITVTLPEWSPPPDAPLALRQQWNRYQLAIRRHEEGHVRLARETGRRVHEALVGLTAADCDSLKALGTEVGERIMAEGRAEQQRYDDETDYGQTQGVRWVIDRRQEGR